MNQSVISFGFLGLSGGVFASVCVLASLAVIKPMWRAALLIAIAAVGLVYFLIVASLGAYTATTQQFPFGAFPNKPKGHTTMTASEWRLLGWSLLLVSAGAAVFLGGFILFRGNPAGSLALLCALLFLTANILLALLVWRRRQLRTRAKNP